MLKNKLPIIWAYLVEVILTGLLYGLAFLIWGFEPIAGFFNKIADVWITIFTPILLGGSIAFLWTFYSKSDTDFAKWLYHKKAFNNYLRAFLTATAIFFITTIAFVITKATQNKTVAVISGGLFILSVFNVYSFFKNIIDITKLNIAFNIKLDQEKQKNGG